MLGLNVKKHLRWIRVSKRRLERHGGDPAERAADAIRTRARAEQIIDQTEEELAGIDAGHTDFMQRWTGVPYIGKGHVQTIARHATTALKFRAGGGAMVLFEMLISALAAVEAFHISAAAAVGVGMATALLVAISIEGLFGAGAMMSVDRPRETIDRLQTFIRVIGPLWVALLLIGFYLRSAASPFELVNTYGWVVVLTGLNLITPTLAALLFYASTIFSITGILANAYHLHLELLEELRDLVALCDRVLAQVIPPDDPGPGSGEEEEPGFGNIRRALMVGALMLLPPFSVAGQSDSLAIQEAATPQIEFLIVQDTTNSVDTLEMATATEKLIRALPELLVSHPISTIRLMRFAGNGWPPPEVDSFQLPLHPRHVQCPYSRPDTTGVIRWRIKEAMDDWEAECQGFANSTLAAHDEAVETLLGEMRRIATPAGFDGKTCTALWDTVHSVANSSRPLLAVILTDGRETCAKEVPSILPYFPKTEVVIALLSPASLPPSKTRGSVFEAKKSELLERLPWLRVVAAVQLDSNIFRAR